MAEESIETKARVYPAMVIVAGLLLWLGAGASLAVGYAPGDQLVVLALVPMVVMTGMFPNTFPLPSGLKLTQEKLTFTYSDAIVLLVACWYGLPACIFIAGIEGFTSSRRAVRRFSSNLYSFSMMSLAAAAAALTLGAVLSLGGGGNIHTRAFPTVAIAMLVASVVHIIINSALYSFLFSVRLNSSFLQSWRQNFLWTAPMFLPTSAAASLMYIALQYNALTMIVLGAPILLAIHFGHRRHRDSVQEQLNIIERSQQERILTLEQAHRETIEALAVTINAKDEVTHEHVLRVQIYAAGVARLLGCTDAEIEALRAGALLHDIGKIAVPDFIIKKPGKLTAAEFEKMKTHTLVGAQILGRVGFSYPVVPVVRSHHERWDGKGYPDGLAGESIPLTARILSVVDCFDAVREDRQYRKGMTRAEAIDYLMGQSGTQYDPRVVGIFITHLPEFEAEIAAHRNTTAPTYGIEPVEQLSEAARHVAPAAGLAEAATTTPHAPMTDSEFTDAEREVFSITARRLSEARSRDEVIACFIESLKTLVPYDSCAVTLAPPHADAPRMAHADGRHADLLHNFPIIPGEGVTGWALANRQSFYNTDPKLDLPPAVVERDDSYRTLAACPIMHGVELHGVVTLYSATLRKYEIAHRQLLEALASLLAATLSADAQVASSLPPTVEKLSQGESAFSLPLANLTGVALESEMAH